jgi:protein TonB
MPYARPSLGAAGSLVAHLVAAALMAYFSRDDCALAETACLAAGGDPVLCREQYNVCKGIEPTYDLVEFELPEPEPEKPPEPEPEPEKPPEPEPVPEPIVKPAPPTKVKASKPERKVKPAPVSSIPRRRAAPAVSHRRQPTPPRQQRRSASTPAPPAAPPAAPATQLQGHRQPPQGRPRRRRQRGPWEPRGELYIRDLPQALNVPQEQCPAVQELGIQGVVILTVQVRRDGSVKDVKISKDIGHGCGKVAARALRRARFKAAIATNGQPADFELRWEYEFQLTE